MPTSALSATLSLMGGKIGIMLLTAIYTPLIVRFLGPELYGKYAIILSIFAIANVFLTSGTNDGIRKFISERSDPEWRNAVFANMAILALMIAVAISVIFIVVATTGIVERFLGEGYRLLFYILAVFAIGRQCREFLMRTLLGLQLEKYSEPLRILRKAMYTSLAVAAAYLGYGVAGVLVADIIANLVMALVIGVVLLPFIDLRLLYPLPPSPVPFKHIISYVGSTVVFFGLLTTLYNIDILFLQYWESETTVGYYKGALVLAEMLWIGPTAIQLSLLQRVSKLWAEDDIAALQKQASVATRYGILMTILLALGLSALAYDFVPLYFGTGFEQAVLPLLILIPGVVGFAAARPTLAINQARRSLRPLIIATGACAVVNVALNVLFIPRYGMIGAAAATSIGYCSLILFQTITARHLGYSPFHDFPIAEILITSVVAAGVIFGVSWSIESSLISLVVVPPVGLIVFCVMAVFTGAIREQETELLFSQIKSRL